MYSFLQHNLSIYHNHIAKPYAQALPLTKFIFYGGLLTVTTELTLAVWMIILAVVQILLPAAFRNRETGLNYNAGPRDEAGPPVGIITGRLQRAQRNFYETLPLFLAAVIIAHIAGRDSNFTYYGAWLYAIARVVYVPAYALGIPYLRSFIWFISMAGLAMIILALAGL